MISRAFDIAFGLSDPVSSGPFDTGLWAYGPGVIPLHASGPTLAVFGREREVLFLAWIYTACLTYVYIVPGRTYRVWLFGPCVSGFLVLSNAVEHLG